MAPYEHLATYHSQKSKYACENLETNNLVSDYHSDKDIEYTFGWSRYSEITNGRFAMLGFLAILIIELISNKSFLSWAGIIN